MSNETPTKFLKSLIAAQKATKDAIKSATNPHFKSKYAPYEEIVSVCKKPLNDNGIFISHKVSSSENKATIETILQHESGELWSSGKLTLELGDRGNMQTLGGAITYGKRYQLAALLCIPCDEDLDGNDCTNVSRETYVDQRPELKDGNLAGVATTKQLFRMLAIAKGLGWDKDQIKFFLSNKYQVENPNEIPRNVYREFVDNILEHEKLTYQRAVDKYLKGQNDLLDDTPNFDDSKFPSEF